MAITVTAQQGGTTNPGMCLTVKVLTGQATTQNGASATSSTTTTPQLAITPNGSGNLVYGAVSANVASTYTPLANTTFQNNSVAVFGTYRSTSTTSGAATYGASAPTVGGAGQLSIAELEIIAAASGSLAEDASSPAVLVNSGATSLTTASFSPPAGSLLVAVTDTNGGQAGTLTMTVSDTSGLSWTQKVSVSGSGLGYAGVWIAQIPVPPASVLVVPQAAVMQAANW